MSGLKGRWQNKVNPLLLVFVEETHPDGYITGYECDSSQGGKPKHRYLKEKREYITDNFIRG
ncbi:hypothetical protein SAMN05421743_12155 [Thalassobacillus cyri]|uniref:Uncharacterized protein n=1 Tax=Thalassobacillus cyri TaxID=571932 RepID=A0A1H4H232_9BACI|nr:hypothetical protein [Thalassobacillus cyri]SEB15863.1 hypothetical protein SAMN05421743_12155 [Thalassobacillus cyri]